VPHLLRHGTSVFKVISKRPVILPSECRALDEGAITTYLNVLGLTRPARPGLELTIYRLLSGSTTTRLRQPNNSIIIKIFSPFLLQSKLFELILQFFFYFRNYQNMLTLKNIYIYIKLQAVLMLAPTPFSSPELNAQVSNSDRRLSVVCPSVNFHIFDFSRTTGPILTRLGTDHLWGKGFQVCSNEGDCSSPRGDNSESVKLH
jgi:hypothetical protein